MYWTVVVQLNDMIEEISKHLDHFTEQELKYLWTRTGECQRIVETEIQQRNANTISTMMAMSTPTIVGGSSNMDTRIPDDTKEPRYADQAQQPLSLPFQPHLKIPKALGRSLAPTKHRNEDRDDYSLEMWTKRPRHLGTEIDSQWAMPHHLDTDMDALWVQLEQLPTHPDSESLFRKQIDEDESARRREEEGEFSVHDTPSNRFGGSNEKVTSNQKKKKIISNIWCLC
ncbi:hypothetical protein RFI_08735 [Reticulomyxa filosa]|uniref:Uncharacterized protein n=1 Tax=Reticulomyxa filosa TaxID=46433 RepID=X6NR78_RETFI|nr:hypothetical protein RFI_08735 [Reticulomyxa filosa]|eukprot:ETO28398.1 hypothetical protein RFI_08735 [Reticulomyxa filosa]